MWVIALLFFVWGLGTIFVGILLPGELRVAGIGVGAVWISIAAALYLKFRDVEEKSKNSPEQGGGGVLKWFDSEERTKEIKKKREMADKLKWLAAASGLVLFLVFMAELVQEIQILLRLQAHQAGIMLNFLIMTALLLFPSALVIVIGLKKKFWFVWIFSFWFFMIGFSAFTFHIRFTPGITIGVAAVLFLLPFILKGLKRS